MPVVMQMPGHAAGRHVQGAAVTTPAAPCTNGCRGETRLKDASLMHGAQDTPAAAGNRALRARGVAEPQMGNPTRSWPWVPTMRARVKLPTLSCLLIFSGGSKCTTPSISGASA